MAIEKILMPKLGESVVEGTINTWLVAIGDRVNKYDPIAEVVTDKVNAEVPSLFTGIITDIIAEEGETIPVDGLICYIDTAEGATVPSKAQVVADAPVAESVEKEATDKSMRKRYSPAVLRLAGEHDVDLNEVDGTGLGGRITRKDIEAFMADKNTQKAAPKQTQQVAKVEKVESAVKRELLTKQSVVTKPGDIEIPVTGVRKVIAEQMVRAKQEIPHAWMMIEVDVTDLVKYRNKVKAAFKAQEGYNLTFFAFFVKAIAQALKEYPQLNSIWADDKIIQRKDVNLSFAVAKEDELFVPVIKDADDLSVKGIAKAIFELANRARSGKLTMTDVEGGTFTINNTGSFGSVQSVGIINHPQAAILQVESIVKRPVIINDMFAARDMVNLCLSLDHRILDGLVCGRFLARVKEILENINEETTNVF